MRCRAQWRAENREQCATYDAGKRADRRATRADSILAIGKAGSLRKQPATREIDRSSFASDRLRSASSALRAISVASCSAWKLHQPPKAEWRWRRSRRSRISRPRRPRERRWQRSDCAWTARDARARDALATTPPTRLLAAAGRDLAYGRRETSLDAHAHGAAVADTRCRRWPSGRPRCRAAMASWISGSRSVLCRRACQLANARDFAALPACSHLSGGR